MKITLENSMEKFQKQFAVSKEMTAKNREIIPGAYSRKTFNFGPFGIYVDHGDGTYIYTVDGHKMMDLNNNFTVMVLGHNHPAIVNAVKDTIDAGILSFGNPTHLEGDLAQMLIDRVDSIEQVKFSCSASESCISAVRIARGYTGKTKIAKMEGGYHGFIDQLAVSGHPCPAAHPGPAWAPRPMADCGGIPQSVVDEVVLLTQNDLEMSEKVLREHAHEVACVLLELQSGSGGVVVLDKEYVQGLRKITEELGILLIFDETISLRAEKGGLQARYGVKPDITIMGKLIGGGFPIGAVGGSKEVFSIMEMGQVGISGTHHGHNIACAAGIATLETLDDAAYAKMNGQAERIRSEINDWALKNDLPFVAYGCHSHMAFGFADKPGREIKTHRDYWKLLDSDKILTFSLEMACRGYFPVHRGELSMNLAMTDDDITGFIETTKEIAEGILK